MSVVRDVTKGGEESAKKMFRRDVCQSMLSENNPKARFTQVYICIRSMYELTVKLNGVFYYFEYIWIRGYDVPVLV